MATPPEGTNRGAPDTSGLGTGQPSTTASPGQLWRRWLEIVESFARWGRTCNRADAGDYRVIYQELIDTCRALACAPGNPNKEVYEQLDRLVSPWLSVEALEKADREILNDLLLRCRQIDPQPGGRRWGFAVRGGVRYLLPFLVIAGGAFLVVRTRNWALFPFLEWANGWFRSARWALTQMDRTMWLFAGGCVLILLASVLIWRAARD